MTDIITLTGIVATPPKSMQTSSGIGICSFRLASSHRRFDRTRDEWVESETNWYTITSFRHLADNVGDSLTKGDHVIVLGRLRIRSWENGERSGTTVEVDAEAVGHDLLWGRTRVTRAAPTRSAPAATGSGVDAPDGVGPDGSDGATGGAQEPAHTPPTDAPPPADPARPLGPNAWPDTAAGGAPSAPETAALATVGATDNVSWHAGPETPF